MRDIDQRDAGRLQIANQLRQPVKFAWRQAGGRLIHGDDFGVIQQRPGPTIDPDTPIRNLKVSQQQIVEIARALLDDAKIIAMDEPTSSLTPREFEPHCHASDPLPAALRDR